MPRDVKTDDGKSVSIVGWGMGWPEPRDSKSSVRKTGKRLRDGEINIENMALLNRWRAAHGYIINTFQASLRRRTKGTRITVGQRLKRSATIIDKLQQGRSVDLWSMHDIAGIRLIFGDTEQLYRFRDDFHSSRAKHILQNDVDRYDYIKAPKESGYRGVHDVYAYQAIAPGGDPWNGLLIEIQYRTRVQHAWATAVEMSDMINGGRTKFSNGDVDNYRFFQLSSELLARTFEGRVSCLPDLSRKQLVDEWKSAETEHKFFSQLQHLAKQDIAKLIIRFSILVIDNAGELSVETGFTYREALSRMISLESQHPDWDVVLVNGDEDSVRSSYRNYFGNASEFIEYMEASL